jgi:hypothetical protein
MTPSGDTSGAVVGDLPGRRFCGVTAESSAPVPAVPPRGVAEPRGRGGAAGGAVPFCRALFPGPARPRAVPLPKAAAAPPPAVVG